MPNGRIHTNQEWNIPYYNWQDQYTKRVGHNLIGWSYTPDGPAIEFPIRDRLVTEDINLHAIWEKKKRDIYQFDYRNGGGGGDGSFFEYGSTIMEAPTPLFEMKNCHAFDGWALSRWWDPEYRQPISFPYTSDNEEDGDFWIQPIVKSAPCAVTVAENGAQSVSVPAGVTEAIMPATAQLPEISLNLAGVTGDAVVTVAPISNPAAAAATPFEITAETKVVDINVEGVTGNVIVCLDGGPTDNVYHFTGGKWETLPERTYANGKVCGVTSNFSPFAAEAPKAANNPAPVVVNPAPVVVNPAPEVVSPAPVVNNPVPAAPAAPVVDNSAALAAAADLAARTVSVKKTLAPNALAKKVGVKASSKAKVTMKVAGSSKKNCAVVAGMLKTLKAGNCVVSFTVQEPKPAKGKQTQVTKANKTLVVK
jgi:hypothetical protein